MSDYLDFLDRDKLTYTPYYCEENIWKLCDKIRQKKPELLKYFHAIFVSNLQEQVLLHAQKLGQPDRNHAVIWDYHVILTYSNPEEKKSLVFDFDSTLQFPCPFETYRKNVFTDRCHPRYQCLFRVVEAGEFLQTFSSDRSRMKDQNGQFIKPPPNYPCIQINNSNNLNNFISMHPDQFPVGHVMNLEELTKKYCFL